MTLSNSGTATPEQFLLQLWQQNQQAISRTLMASEADPAARQDLKQDIFLALHQSAARLQAAEMPRAYLFRIVHNVTVDHIARAKRQQWQALDEDTAQQLQQDCPSTEVAEQQQSQQLMQAVRRLSPANRQVMLLAMEDLDAPEIAEILQISHGAVRVRLNRAKTELMELMQDGR
ncbi:MULTISPECIES: RNA polymerase sigma factor [unclassified Arsukibacterium]|uniref:RNA polymerase sigma factor n=1 Tax=unclassified Arsukibacterium TaxID=2635278 RepID=UPI000C38F2EF|nr:MULTISPECIES: RNA polymerase sigma factor [unclassified Arsukibacterium]MAA94657.1 RNA polymerase subunit sigma-70 [Rheinheimera sp.]MBM32759.1 RNA polymerase subunit sigma-70 [Rheinheimera sp.]HAW93418.1 RNA polymerase sigma factor [Candidatus Azambacteria bacterium]